eukprot:766608-Rhodomonas_salina.1
MANLRTSKSLAMFVVYRHRKRSSQKVCSFTVSGMASRCSRCAAAAVIACANTTSARARAVLSTWSSFSKHNFKAPMSAVGVTRGLDSAASSTCRASLSGV